MTRTASVVVATLALSAAPARAAVIIDFATGGAGAGGVLTVGGGHVSGSSLPVDSLLVLGAPQHNNTFDTSGTATSTSQDLNLAAALSFNTLTGAFSVVGGVPDLDIPDGTQLLTGVISDFTLAGNLLTSLQVTLGGADSKAAVLLTALGLAVDTEFEFLASVMGARTSEQEGTPFAGVSTDVMNVSTVPEPGSMVLLGTGLLGLAAAARRRLKKSSQPA